MAGIEKTEAFKCMECDTAHEDIDDAITCCGLEITVKGKMIITFEARLNPNDLRAYKSIVDETVDWSDYMEGDISWNDSDGEIEDVEFDINDVDAPDVEE